MGGGGGWRESKKVFGIFDICPLSCFLPNQRDVPSIKPANMLALIGLLNYGRSNC